MLRTKDGRTFTLSQLTSALEKAGGNNAEAARMLGIPVRTMQDNAKKIKDMRNTKPSDSSYVEIGGDFDIPNPIPSKEFTTQEIIEQKKQRFDKVITNHKAQQLVKIRIKQDGPIGILHMGDPHLDDNGCDIGKIERHVKLVTDNEAMYAGNVGDFQNNWVGRLARIYAQQSTTSTESWKLVEWLVTSIRWLYIVNGNHDLWVGDGNPLDWIVKQTKVGQYANHGARIELNLPSGKKCIINARHDHKGHSMWNPSHGVMKAAQMGWRDHILVAGHKHISGHSYLKDPMTGRITHGVQVASYKTVDDYAAELGCQDQNMFCAPVTIINPAYNEDDVRFIRFEPHPEEAVEILAFMRKKFAKGITPCL